MNLVALKNVRKEIWQHFKKESARHGLKMNQFFEKLVRDHESSENKRAWNAILKGDALLSEEEANILREEMSNFRKDFDFRIK